MSAPASGTPQLTRTRERRHRTARARTSTGGCARRIPGTTPRDGSSSLPTSTKGQVIDLAFCLAGQLRGHPGRQFSTRRGGVRPVESPGDGVEVARVQVAVAVKRSASPTGGRASPEQSSPRRFPGSPGRPQCAEDRGRGVAGPLGPRDPGVPAQPRAEHLPLSTLRPRGLHPRGRNPDPAGSAIRPGPVPMAPLAGAGRTNPTTGLPKNASGAETLHPSRQTPRSEGGLAAGAFAPMSLRRQRTALKGTLRSLRRYSLQTETPT